MRVPSAPYETMRPRIRNVGKTAHLKLSGHSLQIRDFIEDLSEFHGTISTVTWDGSSRVRYCLACDDHSSNQPPQRMARAGCGTAVVCSKISVPSRPGTACVVAQCSQFSRVTTRNLRHLGQGTRAGHSCSATSSTR